MHQVTKLNRRVPTGALVMLERSAGKLARCVLRRQGGRESSLLPGCQLAKPTGNAMIETVLTSAIVAVITAIATSLWRYHLQERKIEAELKQQEERLRTELRTEFMAEEAIRKLLLHETWEKRSFEEIKRRVGGFEDEELRKLLVRAGAVRFYGKEDIEFWGLIERNEDHVNKSEPESSP